MKIHGNVGEVRRRTPGFFLLAGFLSILLLYSTALAQNVFLAEAKDHMAKLDYERALKSLRAALAAPDNSRTDVISIHLLAGICYASLGHDDKSETAFARLLSIEPGYVFASKQSPRISKPFERARAKTGDGIRVQLKPVVPDPTKRDFWFQLTLLSDPMDQCRKVVLFLRPDDQPTASWVRMKLKGAAKYKLPVNIPPGEAMAFDYYLQVTNDWNGVLKELGSAGRPLRLALQSSERTALAAAGPSMWYESWWFWTIVGGVAIAATATGSYFLLRPEDSSVDFNIHER